MGDESTCRLVPFQRKSQTFQGGEPFARDPAGVDTAKGWVLVFKIEGEAMATDASFDRDAEGDEFGATDIDAEGSGGVLVIRLKTNLPKKIHDGRTHFTEKSSD